MPRKITLKPKNIPKVKSILKGKNTRKVRNTPKTQYPDRSPIS